jgi:hypothetical protein
MNMDWKHFANWWKLFVAVEIGIVYFFWKLPPGDLIQIGLFQYGLFFPIDVSLIAKSIRGESGSNVQGS